MEAPETPTAPPPQTEPPEPQEPTPPPEENLVGEAKRKQRQAEREAKELRERLDALEDKDRSEVEKAQKRAEDAEKRAQELEGRTKSLERGGWLQQAASEAGFTDPADAVAFANLDEIEDEPEAKRFVKNLAESKKHLLKPTDDVPREIGRVLQNGQPSDPQQAAQSREEELRRQEADTVLSVIKQAHGGQMPT